MNCSKFVELCSRHHNLVFRFPSPKVVFCPFAANSWIPAPAPGNCCKHFIVINCFTPWSTAVRQVTLIISVLLVWKWDRESLAVRGQTLWVTTNLGSCTTESLGELVRAWTAGPTWRIPGSLKVGWGPQICLSNKFSLIMLVRGSYFDIRSQTVWKNCHSCDGSVCILGEQILLVLGQGNVHHDWIIIITTKFHLKVMFAVTFDMAWRPVLCAHAISVHHFVTCNQNELTSCDSAVAISAL